MRRDRRRYRFAGALRVLAWGWVAASLVGPNAILGQTRVGSEFQVNTYTPDSQRDASVASTALGGFVVVWAGNLQDGSGNGIFGQRFSSTGAALGGEFQVNQFTTDQQARPSVASSASGDFVVAWGSAGQDDGERGIFARRFSSAGVPVGSEFQVNSYTAYNQYDPSVAAKPDGDFVVVWQSYGQDHDDGYHSYGVFGQRFSSGGTPVGGEFQVNTYTPGDQRYPSVSMAADGRFVVAWESYIGLFIDDVVFAQRFSSEGAALGGEIQVDTYTSGNQTYPAVAVLADGGFVVAWQRYGSAYADYPSVFSRRFTSAGSAVGAEFEIDSHSEGGVFGPVLAVAPDGGFIVVWTAYDAIEQRASARRYDSAGSPLASEFQVNSYTGLAALPAIAIAGAGKFVIAWQSEEQEGEVDETGIFAHRFALDGDGGVELDIDGDGETDALTDGALVLRWLFGFTGTTLTNGVDTEGCSRCDAEDIEPYIAGLGLTLDIDGDGALEPLTDGLLVVRFLFGFTGTALTDGAVNTGVGNCTRCDASVIEPYLLGLTS